jgi:tRNA-2-methylthio-N6-dimethylallyladenosine synthase
MKRNYTVGLYDDMMARIRETVPGASVSSDFIVGFCGETEASFERSVALVERSRFKNSFIFKYSTRPGTKADSLYPDDVPEEVKKRRNNDLLAVQTAVSRELNAPFVGREVEVLVEGPSDRALKGLVPAGPLPQLTGRTQCDRIAIFEGPERLVGRLVRVRVTDVTPVTLFGEVVAGEHGALGAGARGMSLPIVTV